MALVWPNAAEKAIHKQTNKKTDKDSTHIFFFFFLLLLLFFFFFFL